MLQHSWCRRAFFLALRRCRMSPISLFVLSWQNTARIEKIRIELFFGQSLSPQTVYAQTGQEKAAHIIRNSANAKDHCGPSFSALIRKIWSRPVGTVASLGFGWNRHKYGLSSQVSNKPGGGAALIRTPELAERNYKAAHVGIASLEYIFQYLSKTRLVLTKKIW